MKKKGEKFKAFRERYFALYPSYILEYYQDEIAYRSNLDPKGCIDLSSARRILNNEDRKRPHSIKIITDERDWILQCHSSNDRKEWINAMIQLLQNYTNRGMVSEYCIYHKNIHDTQLLIKGFIRNYNWNQEDWEDHSNKIINLCKEYYYEEQH